MSFVTLVALVTFLAPKTAPSPLVRWVLYKSKLKELLKRFQKGFLSHVMIFPHRSAPEECPLNDGNLLNVRLFVKVACIICKILKVLILLHFLMENTFLGLCNVLEILPEGPSM